MRIFVLLFPLLAIAGCDAFKDPATRVAFDIEAGVGHLGRDEGAHYVITHQPPSGAIAPNGSYTVQLDKVGALIVWYKDKSGNVTASGSTSYHARFVDTPRTYILDKAAGSVLSIEVKRVNGKAVIIDVQ